MSKFTLMSFSFIVAGILISLASTTTNAQSGFPANVVQQYTNKPCTDPYVSWALWNRSEGFHDKGTSGECNRANYGSWNTAAQLLTRLDTYRYEQKMRANGIGVAGSFAGTNRQAIVVFKKGGAYIGINVGLVNENRDCCWIGSTLIGHDGASVIAQGAGNFVSMKDIVAQGGAKLIGSDGAGVVAQGAGNVVAQGAGNLRQLLAAGQTGFQFPNRYAIVSGPQPQAAKPSTPNIGGSSGHSDESILLCINSQSSALRQIRAADGGANHITLTVSSGIATFTGNVLSQSSKNTLTSAATNCGARTVNANGLRIGK